MKHFLNIILFLVLFQFVKAQKSKSANPTLVYTQAIGQFISEKHNVNYPVKDTITIFNLDKSVVDTIPKRLKGITLRFITWEETQILLGNIDTLQALQIWTTDFDNIRSFIFLPLKITKGDIFRDYEHICAVSYYMNKNKTLEYKGIHCGSGLKIDD